jgi:hypothetical protein
MNQPNLDVAQLQKQDPAAWTALLRGKLDVENLMVTAVTAEPYSALPRSSYHHRVTRYLLSLTSHSDPISFIAKRTNRTEAIFYRTVAPQIPFLAPRCWFSHLDGDKGWVLLEDVPNHFSPESWSPEDIEAVILDMAALHTIFWRREKELQEYGVPHFIAERRYTWQELSQEQGVYVHPGPVAAISEHAIHHAGRLAPILWQAANGLAVLRDLGGWPGILEESHLAAAADLLDDPVPMFEPLNGLPTTLLHGSQHSYHWRLTLFDERRLLDWQKAAVGPGICDLVNFLEQFDLLYADSDSWRVDVRRKWPASEETMVDTYMLAMSSELGAQFSARSMRQAMPAARCLHILTNWFPHFATWSSQLPSKPTWQKVNRMSDEQLAETGFAPMITFRPYLAAVFKRFLHAYRTL